MTRKYHTKSVKKTKLSKRNKSLRRQKGGNVDDLEEYLLTLNQGSPEDNIIYGISQCFLSDFAYNDKYKGFRNALQTLQGKYTISNVKIFARNAALRKEAEDLASKDFPDNVGDADRHASKLLQKNSSEFMQNALEAFAKN
jgi:hypothetical protein